MRNIVVVIFCYSITPVLFAQSSLPACGAVVVSNWTNCQGATAFPSGTHYVGEFRDGKPHGQGTGTFSDGSIYVGEHQDGKFHGQGTFTSASGEKYVGRFRGGKFDGQGTYTSTRGFRYVGEFTDGKYDGQGILTFADGRSPQEGIWVNNILVSAQRIPDYISGRMATPDGFKETAVKQSIVALEAAKEKCKDLGFKLGTEKFGDCVLRLSK